MCFSIQKRFDSSVLFPPSPEENSFKSLSKVQREVGERFSGLISQTRLLLHWLHPSLLTPLFVFIHPELPFFSFSLCFFASLTRQQVIGFRAESRGLTGETAEFEMYLFATKALLVLVNFRVCRSV